METRAAEGEWTMQFFLGLTRAKLDHCRESRFHGDGYVGVLRERRIQVISNVPYIIDGDREPRGHCVRRMLKHANTRSPCMGIAEMYVASLLS